LAATCEVMRLDAATLPAWRRLYARLDHRCIYASPDYIRFLARHYGDQAELFTYAEGDRLVYYPYFRRAIGGPHGSGRCDFHSSWYYGGPYGAGPAADEGFLERFRGAFAEHARAVGCVSEFVRFDPNAGNEALLCDDATVFDRETVYVDLRLGRDEIWRQFDQSNRWAINRAKREGIRIEVREVDDETLWQRFVTVYDDEMVRKNAPEHLRFGTDFFETLRRTLAANLRLVVAASGETVCGAHLVIFDDTTAYAYLSATAQAFWSTQVNNLMWSEAIWWALGAGKQRYDLQGGRPGVFRFKSHFSKTRGRFFVRRKVHDRDAYDALTAAAGRDGANDFFPAYRAP
jgi:CelD/BcsL family acetyltransferase involved in cellulose biosynthesis